MHIFHINVLNSYIKISLQIQNLPVPYSLWAMGDAGVLICFHFVDMSTFVLVGSTQLLESIDLNCILGPVVKVKQIRGLVHSLTPMKCYIVSL